MAEGKQEKKAPGAAPTPGAAEAPAQQVEQVYTRYQNSLQDAGLSTQARVEEEQRNYLRSHQEIHIELQKKLQEACQRHARALEEVAGNENAAQILLQAHRQYEDDVNAAHVAARNKAEELDRNHRDNLEAARTDYTKRNEESYRSLVRELQGVLTRVDPDSVDVQQIGLLGNVLLAATQTARAKIPPV